MKRSLLTVCLSALVISATLIVIWSCSVNPVTGKKELMLFSEKNEIAMGKNLDRGMRMEIGIYANLNLNAYVKRIGDRLVPFTHRPNLKYHFKVLDTPVVNAFAAPGGYIYVTRGLLALVNSEAELAVILGHELGHVNARHSVKALTKRLIFTLGLAVASELNEKIKKYAPLAFVAGQLLFLKYSRDNEYQADALGVEYARKGGYPPGKMISFFNSLNRMKAKSGGSGIPGFLSTHPMNEKRIDKIREMITAADRDLPHRRRGYLRMIDNLVYGENPRNGFRRDGYFIHPDMGFKFRTPMGWKVKNSPANVIMTNSAGSAVVVFSAEQSQEGLEQYSTRLINKLNNFQITGTYRRYINGFNALNRGVTLRPENQDGSGKPVFVDLTCIRKGKHIFSFFSTTEQDQFYSVKRTFEGISGSFSVLRNTRYQNVRPKRIRIRTVNRRVRLNQFLRQLGITGKRAAEIAHLNSLRLNTVLRRGRLLKILVY